jgi:hypothetical protein
LSEACQHRETAACERADAREYHLTTVRVTREDGRDAKFGRLHEAAGIVRQQ